MHNSIITASQVYTCNIKTLSDRLLVVNSTPFGYNILNSRSMRSSKLFICNGSKFRTIIGYTTNETIIMVEFCV